MKQLETVHLGGQPHCTWWQEGVNLFSRDSYKNLKKRTSGLFNREPLAKRLGKKLLISIKSIHVQQALIFHQED